MIQEIFKVTIDFDKLLKWRDKDRDDIPVCGFIALYKALGIVEAAQNYKKDHPDFEVIPLDNIFFPGSEFRNSKSLYVSSKYIAHEKSPGNITVSYSVIFCIQFSLIFSA